MHAFPMALLKEYIVGKLSSYEAESFIEAHACNAHRVYIPYKEGYLTNLRRYILHHHNGKLPFKKINENINFSNI